MFLFLLCIGTPIAGQSPALGGEADLPASETIEKSVDEVNIFFSALNGSGKVVPGLRESDFLVMDQKEPMPVSFFQSQTDAPLRISVAIDMSDSVARRVKWEVNVANEFLASVVRPGDVAEIAGFGTQRFVQRDLPNAGERLLAIAKANERMGTAVYDAIWVSAREMRQAAGSRHRSILVLMTDGEDNASHATADDALRAAEESGAIVYVLYTGEFAPDSFLRKLAKNTGGRVFEVGGLGSVSRSLAKLATMLREQYVIAFRPRDLKRDGSFHPVTIKPLRKGVKVYCRRGYFAVAEAANRRPEEVPTR